MITRDSKLWWVGMIGAIIVGISSRMDLLDLVLPVQHQEKAHAIIEILALVIAAVSGKMATSPLALSDEGRKHYEDKADGL